MCKNVNIVELIKLYKNNNLYEEISNLLGLYFYTKDKNNIKPYIIIDK
jgi:hypothetical protein